MSGRVTEPSDGAWRKQLLGTWQFRVLEVARCQSGGNAGLKVTAIVDRAGDVVERVAGRWPARRGSVDVSNAWSRGARQAGPAGGD